MNFQSNYDILVVNMRKVVLFLTVLATCSLQGGCCAGKTSLNYNRLSNYACTDIYVAAGVVTLIIISGKCLQRFSFETSSMPQPPLSSAFFEVLCFIDMIDVEYFIIEEN